MGRRSHSCLLRPSPAQKIAASAVSAGTPTFGTPVAPSGGFGKRGAAARPIEADIGDYSFDRAVICDRAETVDLLVANNFHFENNCAVLSIDGYPRGPFETIRKMLKRNPQAAGRDAARRDAGRLQTCAIASPMIPEWFDGKLRIVDLGLAASSRWSVQGALSEVGNVERCRRARHFEGGGDLDAEGMSWNSPQCAPSRS